MAPELNLMTFMPQTAENLSQMWGIIDRTVQTAPALPSSPLLLNLSCSISYGELMAQPAMQVCIH